jgi:predicted anti-sigma-YlaC factor YlaD
VRPADCDLARERVSLELDGELSPHEMLLLERHLDRCPACASFAFDVRRYTDLLRAVPLEGSPSLVLWRRAVRRRAPVRVGAAVASVAAAALVAVSTFSALKPSSSGSAAPFGFSPAGLTVRPSGDENLGVQRAIVQPRPGAGPRRGLLAL